MSTSGSADFAITRNDIFDTALNMVGVLGESDSADAEQYAKCSVMLNLMVKAWMARGINLWAMKEATLFLAVETASYSLGPTGTHCTNTYVQTTLSTDEATSSTSLSLTSTTGMAASDHIGIVLDDGTIHWATISGTPGAPTTITPGLASAASSGNVVFTYTTKIYRPQRLVSAYRRDDAGSDSPVAIVSRAEYVDLPNKSSSGKSIQVFYHPTLTNGLLYAWPTPDLATDVLRFWYSSPIEDFDGASDNPYFPIEWGEALMYGLADRLCAIYKPSMENRKWIKAEAAEKLELAMGYDVEPVSMFFQPDLR